MDAQKGNIFEILNGNRQFVIPVYQRFYSWDISQCKRLWDDIVAMERQEKEGHFVGAIVNIAEKAMPTGVQKFMIIDGQQRVTTLTLLLLALRDYVQENQDGSINPNKINDILLKNPYEDGLNRYKLLLTDQDREILISLVERKPLTSEGKSRIRENYEFFSKKIASKNLEVDKIYESIGKLQIVNITLDREKDDAQAIFESLNSTGKELSESDLIRNYILMGLEARKQRNIYECYWRPLELFFGHEQEDRMDAYFRTYLTMKLGRIPKKGNIYEEFKSYYMDSSFEDVQALCQDLLIFVKIYTDIIFVQGEDQDLKSLYRDIVDLKMEVSYPFLLKVHKDYQDGVIDKEDLIEVLGLCISYVLRRNICSIPTNSLNKTFATLKNWIQEEDYLNSIKAFFVSQVSYKVFPTDEEFSLALQTRDIYNLRNRYYILGHLENHDNKAPIKAEYYTIEHIMPQNPNLSSAWRNDLGDDWERIQKDYLHTLGNLTLTAYNSEMGDAPFMKKKTMKGGFKESALRLNLDLLDLDKWDEEAIKARGEKLARKSLNIWTYPKISRGSLEKYNNSNQDKEQYSLDSYGANEETLALFETLNKRIMHLSPEVRREFNKYYVAYKLDTNFVDVILQKSSLRLTINMPYGEIRDSKGLCRDIRNLGKWGNGEADLKIQEDTDLEDVMEIIEQSFDYQLDN